MNEIVYIKATEEDVKTIVDHRIMFALELAGEQPKESVDALREQMTAYFLKATSDKSCISFIAKCGNETAGIGSVHIREVPGNFKNLSGKWGYVMNMFTVKKFRKKGICSAILQLLMKEASKSGITTFELHATKEGEPVYQSNGFKIHPQPTLRLFNFQA